MGHLILQRDNFMWPGFSLLGESSLAITMDDTGVNFQRLDFLVLSGTTSVSIASTGTPGGVNILPQLAETTNNLTTVTLSGSEEFALGFTTHQSNSSDGVVTDIAAAAASPTTVHSSLKLIDASAATGNLNIVAGATNTSGEGHFQNGDGLNANVTITYTGLTAHLLDQAGFADARLTAHVDDLTAAPIETRPDDTFELLDLCPTADEQAAAGCCRLAGEAAQAPDAGGRVEPL